MSKRQKSGDEIVAMTDEEGKVWITIAEAALRLGWKNEHSVHAAVSSGSLEGTWFAGVPRPIRRVSAASVTKHRAKVHAIRSRPIPARPVPDGADERLYDKFGRPLGRHVLIQRLRKVAKPYNQLPPELAEYQHLIGPPLPTPAPEPGVRLPVVQEPTVTYTAAQIAERRAQIAAEANVYRREIEAAHTLMQNTLAVVPTQVATMLGQTYERMRAMMMDRLDLLEKVVTMYDTAQTELMVQQRSLADSLAELRTTISLMDAAQNNLVQRIERLDGLMVRVLNHTADADEVIRGVAQHYHIKPWKHG